MPNRNSALDSSRGPSPTLSGESTNIAGKFWSPNVILSFQQESRSILVDN